MKANRPNTAKPAQPVHAVSDPDFKFPSFFAMWRDWIVKSEQQWSENVSKLLKDERAASLIGKQVDEARMMHKMYAEMMQSYLAAANLPSRLDLEWLDERMGRVEDGLAAVQAELVQLRSAVVKAGAASATDAGIVRLPRTRRPSAAKPS